MGRLLPPALFLTRVKLAQAADQQEIVGAETVGRTVSQILGGPERGRQTSEWIQHRAAR